MDIVPDYELVDGIKQRLRNITAIRFESHGQSRVIGRSLDAAETERILRNPVNLMHAIAQEDLKGEKHKLIFRKSGKYDYIIVVRFINSELKVVTIHKQNKKRIKVLEKWRKGLIRKNIR